MRVTVIHGPNLNLLGAREPELYGSATLSEIDALLEKFASAHAVELQCRQYNSEGAIIDALHDAGHHADAVVLNPGAYAHYSYAIADAARALKIPVVEVHLSNIAAREPFRNASVVAGSCAGSISGFQSDSYLLALQAVLQLVARPAGGGRGRPLAYSPQRVNRATHRSETEFDKS